MGRYTNLDRKEINKRVGELISQYAAHGIKLEISADDIHDKRQHEIWYGGRIASFRYKDRYMVTIAVSGDVAAELGDGRGVVIAAVKDRQNRGRFYNEMHPYIPDDAALERCLGYDGKNWTGESLLYIGNNNWMEVRIRGMEDNSLPDTDYILEESEGVLDIGYEKVICFVDCCVDGYESWRGDPGHYGEADRPYHGSCHGDGR